MDLSKNVEAFISRPNVYVDVRPAIDLSHERHGQIIDYADENDIVDITDAYDELLEAGLEVKRDED